jgi:anti-sigma B factor antagonist
MSTNGKLDVQTATAGDTAILTPVGDIDINTQPVLAAAIKQSQTENGIVRLVIDLTGVSYMDSSGVATLVQALQTARKRSTKLVLAAPQQRVLTILQIARLDSVFRIVPDLETAKSV